MENDYFLDIAMTKHPIGDQVKEVEPQPVPDIFFKKTTEAIPYQKTDFWQEKTYDDRLETFKKELKTQREYYRPFMENYLPDVNQVKKQYLKQFAFRYLAADDVFGDRDRADFEWEQVSVPDYRGPADKEGRWSAWYKTDFVPDKVDENERLVLQFQCVDYIAVIYVNGNFVGRHEGFFAPFSFDITKYVKANEPNELIIECQNDISILGVGDLWDGDKIYAATGPGWDDPETGWHHCPAGAGVFGKVTLEYRPNIYIDDIFVRPDIDHHYCELRIGVTNYTQAPVVDYEMVIDLQPKNYSGASIGSFRTHVYSVGIGSNEYRYRIPVSAYRLWEQETPWLYGALVTLAKEEATVSTRAQTFGFKKFVSDETTTPKGKFFFNNRPIMLRGANEMGHLQQCVMNNDFDQLIDDILIAKICNLNYYRITQRPVQEEIYDYFDMLGMMHQCDFPLFSFLRRPQFSEALRQVTEMEHLIRRHVSTVMVSFINEPVCIRQTEDPNDKYSKRYRYKGHRELLRDELEAFFVAARKSIYVENPDRVIKNVEGDYDPPTTEGLPDFHCYTMWYSNHGEPIGRLRRGYLPPVKPGYMMGCGEYGAEGLDNLNIMLERYPKEWIAQNEDGTWYPDKITRAQSHSVQGDWYPEQYTMEDWIRESQKHQAIATAVMTDAFRRRADVISHTAIHLLIDAWPAGWMKTLLGCDRIPKPAYFAYQDSLEPLRVNLYCDRQYVYGGTQVPVEAWLLNDRDTAQRLTICATVRSGAVYGESYQLETTVDAATAVCAGQMMMNVPTVSAETKIYLDACIKDEKGEILNGESLCFYVYPQVQQTVTIKPYGAFAKTVCGQLSYETMGEADSGLLISELDGEAKAEAAKALQNGRTVVLLRPKDGGQQQIAGISVAYQPCAQVFFAASEEHYQGYHFNMLYNEQVGYMDFVGESAIVCDAGEDLVYSYAKSGFTDNFGKKPKLPFVKKINVGEGTLYIVSLLLDGRLGVNANLDHFINDLYQ